MVSSSIKEALEGYRVLDLTDEKGLFCGKILADLGAEVIKIERVGGDPARLKGPFHKGVRDPEKSLFWFALNLGKRSVTLNLESGEGRSLFKGLVERADFVLESFPPGHMASLGLDYQELSKINERIILTSISPFGQTGPRKKWQASDLIMAATGGHMMVLGDPDRPPVRISYPQAYFVAASEAALGTLIAHWARETHGEGQHVDVSIEESIIWILQDATLFWDFTGTNVTRAGPLRRRPDSGVASPHVWPCKNGYVCFTILGGPPGARFLSALVKWMDEEGMADDFLRQKDWHSFDWATVTQEDTDPIVERFSAFFAKHTKEELFQEAVKRRVIIYPVDTVADIMGNPQLKARKFWLAIKHAELDGSIIYPRSPFILLGSEGKRWLKPPSIGEANEEVFGNVLGLSEKSFRELREKGVI